MLLVLMYHKISVPGAPERLLAFQQHLSKLQAECAVILPGEALVPGRLNVCLTFDDAYYDFYHHVYPLLKSLNIKAVLAIPTAYIQEETQLLPEQRLGVPYPAGMDASVGIQRQVPLCTWAELSEMVASGQVMPASHSHQHVNLTEASPSWTWAQELKGSQTLLETRLGCSVNTFVYPYGRVNAAAHAQVRQHYRFGMRIGAAINPHWGHPQGLIYRVDADPLWLSGKAISRAFCYQAYAKYCLNRLRGK